MTKMALLVPAAAVFALIFALASAEVAAQGIPVTPADSTIAVGQTMQFRATGIDTARAIEAGSFHQCAVLEDTTLRCWGENDYGQLGNGVISSPPETPNPTPVAVVGVTGAVAVSGGGFHTCAVFANGTVQCWGRDTGDPDGSGGGQLGNASVDGFASPTPVEVTGISTAVALEAGIFHTCVLLQDGRVECWGDNQFFQLGNDPPANNASSTPVTVNGVTSPAALAPGAEHSCVLLQDGRVECWGDNNFGQLGNGSERGIFNPPIAPVTGITGAVAATSGAEHTCALLRGGRVQCWGRGFFGRLGG